MDGVKRLKMKKGFATGISVCRFFGIHFRLRLRLSVAYELSDHDKGVLSLRRD
jgi:hypothetical protein